MIFEPWRKPHYDWVRTLGAVRQLNRIELLQTLDNFSDDQVGHGVLPECRSSTVSLSMTVSCGTSGGVPSASSKDIWGRLLFGPCLVRSKSWETSNLLVSLSFRTDFGDGGLCRTGSRVAEVMN